MGKYNYYILPDILDDLIQQGELERFSYKLDKVCRFISDHKMFWKIQIYGNITDFEALADMDIYGAKSILSYFLDTNDLFQKFKEQNKLYSYSYFIIQNLNSPPFIETTSCSNIEIFENSKNTKELTKFLCLEKKDPITILRVKKAYPHEIPLISNIDGIIIDNLKQEVLFETYIKPEFGDDHENYLLFKDSYLKFYSVFNWKDWDPLINPFPAHNSLTILKKFHKPEKADPYLLKWGLIMALLNGGKFNKLLTQINEQNPKVNYIFQCFCTKEHHTIFYSVDSESGTLEIYDYRGAHLNAAYGIKNGIKKQVRSYTIDVPRSKWLDVNCW